MQNGCINLCQLVIYIYIYIYIIQYKNHSIDVGHTIYSAFTYADVNKPEGPHVQRMAAMYNQESESNGTLMRIAPLCVYYIYIYYLLIR